MGNIGQGSMKGTFGKIAGRPLMSQGDSFL